MEVWVVLIAQSSNSEGTEEGRKARQGRVRVLPTADRNLKSGSQLRVDCRAGRSVEEHNAAHMAGTTMNSIKFMLTGLVVAFLYISGTTLLLRPLSSNVTFDYRLLSGGTVVVLQGIVR